MSPTAGTLVAWLAKVAAAGPISVADLLQRWEDALGRRPRWLPGLARRLTTTLGEGKRPRRRTVLRALTSDPMLRRALERPAEDLSFPTDWMATPAMCPAGGRPESWAVRPFPTVGDLAERLRLTPNELAWFADGRGWLSREAEGPRVHYRYVWRRKRDGTWRLLEVPKLRLKLLQREILRSVLDAIPTHESAHGFVPGRSIFSFVEPHVAPAVLLRIDLKDFFARVTRPRVLAVFLTAGYPEPVASLLAGLCTHMTPRSVLRRWPNQSPGDPLSDDIRKFEIPHLPQGSPASPALANRVAFRLDCRLSGLAAAGGWQYTRYADDLLFSGGADCVRGTDRFLTQVGAILLEEGFEVQWRKVRVMRPGVSQRAAGMVLNVRPNLPRREFDRLKAILTNCVRTGPAAQNRAGIPDFRAHLAGRVAHVARVNPRRGERLGALWERICWD